jgi:hypothetical protein
VHFDYSCLFSDSHVEKFGNPKKVKTVKEPLDENQTECYEMEPNPPKDKAMPGEYNPLF